MSPSVIGLLIGAALGVVAVAFGFWAMVLVALLAAIGYGIGRAIEGKLDVRGVADALRGRRSS
ncbi:DUF2273 domain-containing protein [Microcella daejeonensis]|uniref:DUF2273 domain-containing protein n=1 Tax=Microcella daejeonensis TaxID=2994971 RepID=A0A9E8MN57_9MICO|nr:DUF2273 domain-containing protein [Microcella daejeonensis]WAB82719.1 DUF2273 domain-containing protein [Microcella daejeonensis]WAB85260.1 DUF2273 domain-containing protein [Microcella daejeonensis]